LSNKEKLLSIKAKKEETRGNYNNQILIIIAEELINLNESLSNTTKSFNSYLESIEYNVRTKK